MRDIPKNELLKDLEEQVKCVANIMGVPEDVRKAIMAPEAILVFNLAVPYKGKMVTRRAIRVEHTLPSGGGCRVAEIKKMPEALAETGFLSFLMSLKLGIADEPFGGGKAIVVTDPKKTPRDLLDLLFVEFGKQMAPFMIGRDRIAPDMYTDDRDMENFLKGVTSILGGKIPKGHIRALATGKKPDGTSDGGLLGRPESTGYGVAYAAKLAADIIGLSLKDATIVVQGFGKVGIPAAERMISYGAKIVAVSDSSGGIVNYNGLDLEGPKGLKAFKKEKGTVVGFPGTTFITSEDLLELECDILLPCALEGQISEENANDIKTKVISEGSNMGFTGKAKRIMSEKGIIVLDGILANQAGVDASIVEADQNKDGRVRTFEEVIKHLDEKKIGDSFKETLIRMEKYSANMPDAALALGIERLIFRRLGKTLEEILAERAGKK